MQNKITITSNTWCPSDAWCLDIKMILVIRVDRRLVSQLVPQSIHNPSYVLSHNWTKHVAVQTEMMCRCLDPDEIIMTSHSHEMQWENQTKWPKNLEETKERSDAHQLNFVLTNGVLFVLWTVLKTIWTKLQEHLKFSKTSLECFNHKWKREHRQRQYKIYKELREEIKSKFCWFGHRFLITSWNSRITTQTWPVSSGGPQKVVLPARHIWQCQIIYHLGTAGSSSVVYCREASWTTTA